MPKNKLSIRQAATISIFLRGRRSQGKVLSAAECQWQTLQEVAKLHLGSQADQKKIDALVKEMSDRLGL